MSQTLIGEPSAEIRLRVEKAREVQRERFAEAGRDSGKPNPVACNADMRITEVRKFCKLDEASESLVRSATSCRARTR